MSNLTIPAVDSNTQELLRIEAERNGRSVEEQARVILAEALTPRSRPSNSAGLAIAAIVDPIGGIELDLPPRGGMREPPRFDWMDENE